MNDIIRFTAEINSLDWNQYSLVFLDEVGFDNGGMLRHYGYCMRGDRLIYRGEFKWSSRVSLLCFVGATGVLDTFQTVGTFDRAEFLNCIHKMINQTKVCQQYPGLNSVWILDGAKIHCHPDIIYNLRSIGIVPVFLPAYCPFFNVPSTDNFKTEIMKPSCNVRCPLL